MHFKAVGKCGHLETVRPIAPSRFKCVCYNQNFVIIGSVYVLKLNEEKCSLKQEIRYNQVFLNKLGFMFLSSKVIIKQLEVVKNILSRSSKRLHRFVFGKN
jgi:hypothetical protein